MPIIDVFVMQHFGPITKVLSLQLLFQLCVWKAGSVLGTAQNGPCLWELAIQTPRAPGLAMRLVGEAGFSRTR